MKPKHNTKKLSPIQLRDVGIKGQAVKPFLKIRQKAKSSREKHVKTRATRQGVEVSWPQHRGVAQKLRVLLFGTLSILLMLVPAYIFMREGDLEGIIVYLAAGILCLLSVLKDNFKKEKIVISLADLIVQRSQCSILGRAQHYPLHRIRNIRYAVDRKSQK